MWIVREGEVEIVKTDLRSVYYNENTAVVGVREIRTDGENEKFLKSTSWLLDKNKTTKNNKYCPIAYNGSEFQQSVHNFLRSFIDTKLNYKDKHRSSFNQTAFKEIKLGVYGPGTIYGDIDALRKRQYLFTMRVLTSGVKVWQIDSGVFMRHVRASSTQ